MSKRLIEPVIIFLLLIVIQTNGQNKKPVTFNDIMKFQQIKNPVISENGNWIGYNADPDRGNEKAVVKSVGENIEYKFIKGSGPVFSKDENWACVLLLPDFIEREKKKEKNKLKNDLILLNLINGNLDTLLNVNSFEFSENSNWLAVNFKKEENDSSKSKNENIKEEKKRTIGTDLLLINLSENYRESYKWVAGFAMDSLSNYLAYYKADTSGDNGIYLKDLNKSRSKVVLIDSSKNGNYTELTWHKKRGLAFLKSKFDEDGKPGRSGLYVWNNKLSLIADENSGGENWIIPSNNKLFWSLDGERLFFGYKPDENKHSGSEKIKDSSDTDIYDFDKLLSKKEVDVWHWKDPKIKQQEKEDWKNTKNQSFPAVFHMKNKKIVRLTDLNIPYIEYSNNPYFVHAYSDVPYLIESTWDLEKFDNYVVDLNNGNKTLVASIIRENGSLSPNGKYFVYYDDKHWHLYNTGNKSTVNLTEDIDVPFYDEDHDYPVEVPGYGIAGWIENDKAVLIYDKYDVWKFYTKDGRAENITGNYGRENSLQFRIYKTDTDAEYFGKNETLLLSAYHDIKKYTALYSLPLNKPEVKKLLDGEKKYSFIAKSAESSKYLFTRQSYEEYPDLWISGPGFDSPEKLTNLGSQFTDYTWGSPELIEWRSIDGIKLQGILIKPENYNPEKKYPVFVYYYRFFTQRLYDFPEIVINHRPKYPVLTSNDYCVFLPDIRFEVGRPGYSATKCLVPGIQKLIEMGVADPDAVALHGHSWSGYQTAFVITQTNIFKCAIAGAPVSNMTSAYSGIRWGSGKARQFQYEKSQSRIGGSLWEYPERYYENSPVFFADKIQTPLLIQHGDKDEAVPWYQSIEMYLAMRRLGKDCIFLQYRDEPHHLKKYPNKLDYSIKMMEYLDHHLKGAPAASWITEGKPFIGK